MTEAHGADDVVLLGTRLSFADWARVHRTLQAYADAIDRANIPEVVALFTPGGTWDYRPGSILHGRAEIAAHFERVRGAFRRTHHQIGPPIIARSDNGELQSTAYFTAIHLMVDDSHYTVHGRYLDTLTPGEDADSLLLSRRQVVAHVTFNTDSVYHMLNKQGTDGVPIDVYQPPAAE